jgi:serine/threonine protein kinase
MAIVYRGFFLDDGEPVEVAIKTVLPGLAADPMYAAMFRAETRLAMQLHHRNLVSVFDHGIYAGRPAQVMEYISGCDLRDVLAVRCHSGRCMPVGMVLAIGYQVASGLAYLHALVDDREQPLGLVHRDVSPSNVMLNRRGEVKLLDLGIAKLAGNFGDPTQPGQLKGKLSYMAPEQLDGLTIDQRVDQYMLGALLHELLVCRKLYPSRADLMLQRSLRLDPTPPPSSMVRGVPPSVDALVLRLLAYNADQRFDSMFDAATQLLIELRRLPPPAWDLRPLVAEAARARAARDTEPITLDRSCSAP